MSRVSWLQELIGVADTEEQKEEWKRDPLKYHQYHKMVELELNQRYRLVLRNSRESDEANSFAYKEMSTKLRGNKRLMDAMIPKNFNVACRRPTPGNGYLEALVAEKTTCFTEQIESITENGFTMHGQEYLVDVIICATGFVSTHHIHLLWRCLIMCRTLPTAHASLSSALTAR